MKNGNNPAVFLIQVGGYCFEYFLNCGHGYSSIAFQGRISKSYDGNEK